MEFLLNLSWMYPNDTTAAAIEEGRKLMADPLTPKYSSIDELRAALEV